MEWFVELTTVFINIRIGYQGSGEDGRSGGGKGFVLYLLVAPLLLIFSSMEQERGVSVL